MGRLVRGGRLWLGLLACGSGWLPLIGERDQGIENIGALATAHEALRNAQIRSGDGERQRTFGADCEHRSAVLAAPS
jgi:hypothetical protein